MLQQFGKHLCGMMCDYVTIFMHCSWFSARKL